MSETAKYAHGPWTFTPRGPNELQHINAGGKTIIQVWDWENAEGIARIACAAPLLLEACKDVVDLLDFPALRKYHDKMSAAIAAAEGGADEMKLSELVSVHDALTQLLYESNQAAADDDRGPSNDQYFLTWMDDGSGSFGRVLPIPNFDGKELWKKEVDLERWFTFKDADDLAQKLHEISGVQFQIGEQS